MGLGGQLWWYRKEGEGWQLLLLGRVWLIADGSGVWSLCCGKVVWGWQWPFVITGGVCHSDARGTLQAQRHRPFYGAT